MRTRYLVTYDICEPRRLRKVYEIMKGAGLHLQYSVFLCDLTDRDREELISDLIREINATDDQVLFVELGPPDGTAAECITAVGRPSAKLEHKPTII